MRPCLLDQLNNAVSCLERVLTRHHSCTKPNSSGNQPGVCRLTLPNNPCRFEDFIPKPVNAEEVYAVLERLLHVKFEYSHPQTDVENLTSISLPNDLLERLRSAAIIYKTTEFKRCLEEMEQLGEEERIFAEHLRNGIERSELEKVLRILDQIEGNIHD